MKKPTAKTGFLNFFRNIFKNRVAESLLIPCTTGKQWSDFTARIPANYYQYPKGSIRKVKRNGFQLELDLSDYMQWLLYFGVKTEPRDLLYALVKPGMTVLDIGANIGETALVFARLTGEAGHVYAFEPFPSTFQHLQRHVSWNHQKNITPIQLGLADKPGVLKLENNPNNTAGNRVSTTGSDVQVSTVDAFVRAKQCPKIDFIKIDVEGFELHVLRGADEILRRDKPVLFVEAVDEFLQLQNSSTHALIKFLENLNYSLVNAYDNKPVSANQDFSNSHFDIIAKPR